MLNKIRSSILTKLGLLFCLMAFLCIASVFYTVNTFRALQGVSRAVDVSGSERMRSILLGSLLTEYVSEVSKNQGALNERALKLKHQISEELSIYEEYLINLIKGNEAMGLVHVNDDALIDQLEILKREFFEWKKSLKRAIRPEATETDRQRAARQLSVENAIHLKQTAHKVVQLFESRFRGNVRELKNIQKIILVLSATALFFSIWLIYLIVRPINDVIAVTNKMAEGNLTNNITITRQDEIGILGETINRTVFEWRKILSQLKESSGKLSDSSSNISSTASEIAKGAKEQVEQVIKTSEAMNEMSNSIEEVSRNVQSTVHYAASASERLRRGKAACGETIAAIRKASRKMDELNKKSTEIGKIVHFINDFAEQTNLLAINAAIEAERAGIHGKGFDVVADEIRKLARKIAKFASDIIMVLENIQQELKEVGVTMKDGTGLVENTGSFLDEITEDISGTAERVNFISEATNHQVDISGRIADSLVFISGVSRKTSNNSKESAEETEKLATLANRLKAITEKFQIDGNG